MNIGGEGSPRWKVVEEKGNHEDNPTIERAERWVTLPGDDKPGPINIGDEDLSHLSNWFECLRSGNTQTNATVDNGFLHSVDVHHGGAVVLAGEAAVLRRGCRADSGHRAREVLIDGLPGRRERREGSPEVLKRCRSCFNREGGYMADGTRRRSLFSVPVPGPRGRNRPQCTARDRAGSLWFGGRGCQRRYGRCPAWRHAGHHEPGHGPDPPGRSRRARALQLHRSARGRLQPEGQPPELPELRADRSDRQHQQRHARGRHARSGRDGRHHHRERGAAEAPDRHRGGPSEPGRRGVDEPPGAARAQLPADVPDAAGVRAADQLALDPDEPVAIPPVQRQRHERRPEQHAHRRRQHRAHPAAPRGLLRAYARVDRGGQRRHEQHGRRTGACRRGRDQRADEERNATRCAAPVSSTSPTST